MVFLRKSSTSALVNNAFRYGILATLAAALYGCGSSSTSENPPQNTGGSGGAKSDASPDGQAGSAGTAGKGGSSGSAGYAGSSGSAGSAGTTIDSGLDAKMDSAPDADTSDVSVDSSLDSSTDSAIDAAPSCKGASDCVGASSGTVCDPLSGKCVQCLAGQIADCAPGTYCDDKTNSCTPGCDALEDCTTGADAGATTCDTNTHQCVGCTIDGQCPAGQICKGSKCESGCTTQHACNGGLSCCNGACANPDTDVENCGSCGKKCVVANAQPACSAGACIVSSCDANFANCDTLVSNGCETELIDGGVGCACQPNATQDCYSGPPATKDIGPCKAGKQSCNATGTAWGACIGEVLPVAESCYTAIDDNCNGQINESGTGCACAPNLEEPCYTGDPATRNVGACKDGKRTCNAAGTAWSTCNDQVLPVGETCLTPVDDNCNGQVNEAGGAGCSCTANTKTSCYGGPPGSEGVGSCKAGTQTCNAMGTGYGACEGDVVPSPDICTDSLDNDCNGTVNDGFGSSAAGCLCYPNSVNSCYTGPNGTSGIGLCKAGVATCNSTGTAWGTCSGQVLPTADVCTDLLDNDCNGIANDGFGSGAGGCTCTPGIQRDCYSGPAGTLNKGVCIGGKQTCAIDGKSWGSCIGEIIPDLDTCFNALDDNCDGIVNNGLSTGAPGCVCAPNATASCYSGPAGTAGVGVCKAGVRSCNALGTGFSGCVGEVVPQAEICGNGINEDCVGGADDPTDVDGDGFNRCQGDCCETTQDCSNPAIVNPGAYDVAGNSIDDNCDGTVDNAITTCGAGLASNSSTPADYAKAIDICQTTTAGAKTWGLISAELLLADGTSVPNTNSRAIRTGFGTNITTKLGPNFAVLSSGAAADMNDTNPNYVQFQGGLNAGTQSSFPADWFAANGNALPSAPGCNASAGQTTAYDPVMLRLTLRAPTNAKSFSVNMAFFSAEYPEYVCSTFNDFFVMLLNSGFSGTPANPTDRNLAFYTPSGTLRYPVGINLAYLNNGLFSWCMNGAVGCSGTAGNISTCASTAMLAGTGFDVTSAGGCGSNNLLGGGTGWLVSRGNVVPGEIITLRFAIWDTGDHILDSLVLLDNFQWSLDAAQPGTGVN